MLPKYSVEYSTRIREHAQISHYGTDDPVACEEFLNELLERGVRIHSIRREGLELPRIDFDRMLKTAAGIVAARRLCSCLGIKPEEEKYRFGYGI